MSTDNLAVTVPRPPDLWRAWEATATYIAHRTHEPVTLHLTWNSQGIDAPWLAQLNWAGHLARVNRQPAAGNAMEALWRKASDEHTFFQSTSDARRAPRGYDPDHWFKAQEHALFTRLIDLTRQQADPVCTLLVMCHARPEETLHIQTRMICHAAGITVNGQGTDLLKALQDLYPRATVRLSPAPDTP